MNLAHYERLITDIRALDYSFEPFLHSKARGAAVMRHDVDFCVHSALALALWEAENDLRSTFFFMLTSNTYSLASFANRGKVERIRELGHDISLHFDPSVYADVDRGLVAERTCFESMFGVSVDIVSLHRPGLFLRDNNRPLPGCLHTYQDRFFRDMRYVSDSSGGFKYQHPTEIATEANGTNLHILIHPVWWVNEGETPSDKLRMWQRRYFTFLNEETSRNCGTFDGRMAS